MTILDRIYREPSALLGAVTALLGILTLTQVLAPELAGAIVTAVGALVALLRYVVTPAAEVVVQRKPGARAAVAGPASSITDGTPVVVRKLLESD